MTFFYPTGKRLPALEKNVLKYRAFEMMLVLFQIESLRSFVLQSIRATDKERLPEGTRGVHKKSWEILVSDGIISENERDELNRITNYRNQIAHDIQSLTFDLGRDDLSAGRFEFKGAQYDRSVRQKLEAYRDKIERKMSASFILSFSFDHLLFESAERTYKAELKKLDRKIRRQIATRKRENAAINSELDSVDPLILEEAAPSHPLNFLQNGKLSKRGLACCRALFNAGLSDLAVSYLMRLSLKSVSARRKALESAS